VSLKKKAWAFLLMIAAVGAHGAPAAAQPERHSSVLFTNVRVWDGSSDELQDGLSVLVMKDGMVFKNTLEN